MERVGGREREKCVLQSGGGGGSKRITVHGGFSSGQKPWRQQCDSRMGRLGRKD